jgi:hypothetical protein
MTDPWDEIPSQQGEPRWEGNGVEYAIVLIHANGMMHFAVTIMRKQFKELEEANGQKIKPGDMLWELLFRQGYWFQQGIMYPTLVCTDKTVVLYTDVEPDTTQNYSEIPEAFIDSYDMARDYGMKLPDNFQGKEDAGLREDGKFYPQDDEHEDDE